MLYVVIPTFIFTQTRYVYVAVRVIRNPGSQNKLISYIQKEAIGQLLLKEITSVNAVKNAQFSDYSKYYFEVHFNGDGSPWLLRAYTKVCAFAN